MPRKRKLPILQRGMTPAVPDAVGAVVPIRDRLLALAGYDEQAQAKMLRAAIELLRGKLGALTTQRLVVSQGRNAPSQVEEFLDVDHTTQLRAAEELIETFGGKPSRSAGSGSGNVQVNILVREAEPGKPPVEVIDVPCVRG